MTHAVALALLWAGVGIVVLAAVRAALARNAYNRLHFLTPITTVGGPLIGLSLAIETGWYLATVEILVIIALLGMSGPVLGAATARVAAQRDGLVDTEAPQ